MISKNIYTKGSAPYKFLNMSNVDYRTGYSDIVKIEDLEKKGLSMGNGGSWCRDDGQLGKHFNINRVKTKGKITSVQLVGWKKNFFSNMISLKVREALKGQDCRVLSVGGKYIEIDHKDGRKDNLATGDDQNPDDFQPLHKNANIAKRQHCRECKKTDIRFDATKLGYSVSQWIGPKEYKGDCMGCYWFDPKEFNKEVSKGFKKSK